MRIEAGKVSEKDCLRMGLAFDSETNEIVFPDNAVEAEEETESMKFATVGEGDRYIRWSCEDLSVGGTIASKFAVVNQKMGFILVILEERSPYSPPQDSEALRYLSKKFPAQEWSSP